MLNELLGPETQQKITEALIKYVRDCLQETDEQKAIRLKAEKAAAEGLASEHAIAELFEKWDNDCSGYLEPPELVSVFQQWHKLSDTEAEAQATEALVFVGEDPQEGRLDKENFTKYMIELLLPRECAGDKSKEHEVLQSIMACLQYSFIEEERGHRRKAWLQAITDAASSPQCTTDPFPLFQKAFVAILEDNAAYGPGNAIISAHVTEAITNGKDVVKLNFIDSTDNDKKVVCGQTIPWTEDCVSFSVVAKGKPIHVMSIAKHGNVHMFRTRILTEVCTSMHVI